MGEFFAGILFGFIIGFWSFICILGGRSSRRFRAGIYLGFLFWFLQNMDETVVQTTQNRVNQQKEQRKHNIEKAEQYWIHQEEQIAKSDKYPD